MELKLGYRQTEVGMIPDDWDIKPIRDLADKIMVGIASAATHAYRARGVVLLRNQNIKPGYLDDEDILYIDPVYETTYRNKRLKSGDLLIAGTGYPGTTCVVPPMYESAQSFTTLITRPKTHVVDSHYLCHYINSEQGQAFFEQSKIGGGQKNVNAGTFQNMLIPVPSQSEQRAIAAALMDVDALITSLDKLIAKKHDIKQAAMQQLLTGRMRLPGFSGEWEVKTLAQIATKFLNGGTPSTKRLDYWQGSVPWITGADVVGQRVSEVRRYITQDAIRNSSTNVVEKGNLLIVTRTGVGKLAVAPFNLAISQDLTGVYLDGEQALPEFVFFLLDSEAKRLASLNQGTSIAGITRDTLGSMPVVLPSLPEQQAIAGIFSDMDAEIAALERRCDKTRALKQGMMQELLTGRIRLI